MITLLDTIAHGSLEDEEESKLSAWEKGKRGWSLGIKAFRFGQEAAGHGIVYRYVCTVCKVRRIANGIEVVFTIP